MKRTILIAALFILSTLTQTFASDPPEAAPAAPPVVVPIDKDGVQRVEIVGGDYFFKPAHIVVKVNVPVELIVRKETLIVPHNIVIKAPEAGIKVNESLSRDPKTISFTPTKTGKYPMYCDQKLLFFASHREKGMEGLLEVVE
ncbi:MAG: cupredoxin domain-containing protein [Desulfobacteraceae bacterium]|nr:cupredoxin domain-containing protein [Desulfobacteraceae bacterium]